MVTAGNDGRRQVVVAMDAAAAALGLRHGMPLAQARALVPNLAIQPTEPEADAEALRRMAGWCLRYAPLTSPDPPNGIWIDATGSTHLHGGETAMLRDLTRRFTAFGIGVRTAIADTPGAAHALARYPNSAMPLLPIEALRLPQGICDGLRLMGFDRIGQLTDTPRGPLVRRFGALVATRLDQLSGAVFEPIVPIIPPDLIQARLTFVEPLSTEPAFSTVIARLVALVCTDLENAGQGARRLDLLFERVDGSIPAIRIGTARPSRDPRHLARMLDERLERIDPGLGVEAMRLIVTRADTARQTQTATLTERTEAPIADLVDRLSNRLGAERVFRNEPVESDVPERSLRRVPALQPKAGMSWPTDLPRPIRLLDPPQQIEAMALLPDHPPLAFTWRRVRHRVRRADGPERIAGEWWKRDGEMRSVRDYFRVEDEEGHRFWLFRRGDGDDPATGDRRWFLHGFF